MLRAQIPPPQPNTYVDDFAGVLSRTDIKTLNERLNTIEKEDSVQIAIVLVRKLPDDMEIEDFARGIGREWHVGSDRRGLVYVASIDQNKQRLEVAANLEGTIPDITAHQITDHLKPFLRKKDYAGAMLNLVADIKTHLAAPQEQSGESNVDSTAAASAGVDQQGENNPAGGGPPGWFILLFGIPVTLAFFFSIYQAIRRGRLQRVFAGKRDNYTSFSRRSHSSSSSSSSSSYGDSGGGSSDSSSSDSGFDGGGSSDDW